MNNEEIKIKLTVLKQRRKELRFELYEIDMQEASLKEECQHADTIKVPWHDGYINKSCLVCGANWFDKREKGCIYDARGLKVEEVSNR